MPALLSAQLENDCKLAIGTNLGGIFDYATELPFVNLMRNARQWYTKDLGNPEYPFDSGFAQELSLRPDGYPTHVPQQLIGAEYPQQVATIWAITDGWPAGTYTVLWDGTGSLSFWGTDNTQQTDDHRIVFDFFDPIDGAVELLITESDIDDPVRNIRLLMPGTEFTYTDEPFYALWLEKMLNFNSVRFMDWGSTNNWGQPSQWEWDDTSLFSWDERAKMDDYTWATAKGVPYEMMIKLMNNYDRDGWVCVPHRADDDYIAQMAALFREELEDDRLLTVEYSNEIWNWIFGQTHWLYKYGCEEVNVIWPEGVVPYVQNCLDIWTTAYEGEMHRLSRAVGVHTAWQDVSNRIVNNLTAGSFDVVSPTYYFGFTEEDEATLDALGADATTSDIALFARNGMEQTKAFILSQQSSLVNPLGVEMKFYEGGQHLTPHPFGEEPTYAQALLDIQRDTAMYNLYHEWFDFLKTLQSGEEPLQLMNFSLIAQLSARYGSWGVLETMNQDTNAIYAPKYSAILDVINGCEPTTSTFSADNPSISLHISPNPASDYLQLSGDLRRATIELLNSNGQSVLTRAVNAHAAILRVADLPRGAYWLKIVKGNTSKSWQVHLQ